MARGGVYPDCGPANVRDRQRVEMCAVRVETVYAADRYAGLGIKPAVEGEVLELRPCTGEGPEIRVVQTCNFTRWRTQEGKGAQVAEGKDRSDQLAKGRQRVIIELNVGRQGANEKFSRALADTTL